MKFLINWCPPTLSRQLRMDRYELPRLTRLAGYYIAAAIGRQIPAEQDHRVRVRITMHRRRAIYDDDNLRAMVKPIFDALKKLGWARDDRRSWMDQDVLPVVVEVKGREWTEIEIERL